MKIIDNMPIIIIVLAILTNIALGVRNNIDFTVLMVRCIIVIIVFGIFGYMITKTMKNILEYCRLSKNASQKAEAAADIGMDKNENDNASVLDIKILPLDEKELMNSDSDSDDEFTEVNPANMSSYSQGERSEQY